MKLLIENWREYLNEEEEYSITPEQNQALKGLYIKIRFLLHHFAEWLQKNNISPSEAQEDMIIQDYKPPAGFEGPSQGWAEIKFDVSEFKSALPNLADKFYVQISDEVTGGELSRSGDGTIEGIGINVEKFEDLSGVKRTIQHELQHIIDEGSDASESGVEGMINYLSDAGEVRAHAKEAAYYFHKTFPEENQFDIEKVKEGVSNKYTNYYNFATKASDIAQRRNLDPPYEQKMKKAGEGFIKYVTYYLTLFQKGSK